MFVDRQLQFRALCLETPLALSQSAGVHVLVLSCSLAKGWGSAGEDARQGAGELGEGSVCSEVLAPLDQTLRANPGVIFGIMPGWYGMETAKSWKWGKHGKPNGKEGSAGQGQSKKFPIFPFSGHFLAMFAPVQLGAVFHVVFHFLSHFRLFSMPCQPGMIPKLFCKPQCKVPETYSKRLCTRVFEKGDSFSWCCDGLY